MPPVIEHRKLVRHENSFLGFDILMVHSLGDGAINVWIRDSDKPIARYLFERLNMNAWVNSVP